MILYDELMPAPNPRRVRIFLAEKGLEIEKVRVPIRERAHKAPDYVAKNSLGQLPALELGDGTIIAESVSICRYLEEQNPEPALFGKNALERARVDMWIRRIEFQLMNPVGQFWRHAHPLTASLIEQHRDFGESNRAHVDRAYRWLDKELADGREWVAGEAYSMADIVALSTVDFGKFIGLQPPDDCKNVAAWYARASARPSAAA
ncbi:MAG TPA: glutathione S-transferase family protein [Caulobacteraceae bacterium]|nr:glutathione S-transferase family protein [Caulobacteraceae bacterium]